MFRPRSELPPCRSTTVEYLWEVSGSYRLELRGQESVSPREHLSITTVCLFSLVLTTLYGPDALRLCLPDPFSPGVTLASLQICVRKYTYLLPSGRRLALTLLSKLGLYLSSVSETFSLLVDIMSRNQMRNLNFASFRCSFLNFESLSRVRYSEERVSTRSKGVKPSTDGFGYYTKTSAHVSISPSSYDIKLHIPLRHRI